MATNQPSVQYKGEDLDPERGPGLGCFRFQLIVLVVLLVLTPLSVAWKWPVWISTALLVVVLVLLLVAGQTIIFLLRLVAADRRSRRRPLAGSSPTVGQLEDEAASGSSDIDAARRDPDAARPADPDAKPDEPGDPPPADEGPVRQ